VTHHGRYLHVDDAFLLVPRPVQSTIPLLIGGGGARVLRLGGRHADIVGLTGMGRTLEDGHRHEVDWSDGAIDRSVAQVRDASPDQQVPVLDALVQHVGITEHRVKAAERVASHVPGASAAHILGAPYTLVGTLDQLADEVRQHQARWGFTSYVVRTDAIDAVAALIDRLRRA
jgi:alkanesulfonate monooxygenase SsuD/methylene tetrahydromethanopterin reductase-like flavin-dependent oxidoreductase (luciferase family)